MSGKPVQAELVSAMMSKSTMSCHVSVLPAAQDGQLVNMTTVVPLVGWWATLAWRPGAWWNRIRLPSILDSWPDRGVGDRCGAGG